MQNVVVDIPQNVLLKLLELETAMIPDEDLPDFVVEIIGNCLTTISQVQLALEPHGLDADTYFKAKGLVSDIDSIVRSGNRCPMRVFFSQTVRSTVVRYPVIQIINAENAWAADLLWAFADAICGKTVYGFSDTGISNINIARQRIGLPPLETVM